MVSTPTAHEHKGEPRQASTRRAETVVAVRALWRAVRHDSVTMATRARRVFAPDRVNRSAHPRPQGRRSVSWRIIKSVALFTVLGALVFCASMLWVLRDLPRDGVPPLRERAILLEAADGKPLGRVGPLKISNARREDFPQHLVAAVLSIEDRRFYQHWGVDLLGIARAMRRNYAAGGIVAGGSTITQQLIKLRIVGTERSWSRKLREAFAALWLEMRLGKEEILTRYLNSVYMGAGAQGISAAAELYFNKRPRDLTLPEAAMLAGLIKAPSRFNPLQNLPGAQARAATVLRAMADSGQIDEPTARAAIAHPAVVNTPAIASESSTWFSDWVAGEAQDVTGAFEGTLRVRTTLLPALQVAAEQAVADGLHDSANRNVSQAALVAMRPDGAVVAMVGGRNYKESQFNRAVQARRQPGSAFKLFVYMAALQSGLDLRSTIDASPVNIGGWEPQNYGGGSYGTVTLADAFAHSINTAAVRLAMNVDLDKVIAAARDLGIEGELPKVASLALGAAEVSLLNLTAAYAGVLAGRAPIRPWGVGSFASEEKPRLVSIGAPSSAQKPLGEIKDKLIELLRLPVERGTARSAAVDGFVAGKTGTTQDHRDAWYIGFTEKLVVGVWVGNDDRSPMHGVTGGAVPARIWKSFIEKSGQHLPQSEPVARAPTPEAAPAAPETAAEGACDYRACSAKYQSFNAIDCTYQPFGGGARQRCEEGTPSAGPPARVANTSAPGRPQCDVAACAASYSSFRAADCTYQPYDGGARRLCQKAGRATQATEVPRMGDEGAGKHLRPEGQDHPEGAAEYGRPEGAPQYDRSPGSGYRSLVERFLRP